MSAATVPFAAPDAPAMVFVTPDMATKWLESNTENRNVRQNQVDTLARDMEAGAWQITGDPVKFDTRGVLIDGQHRLWAIVQSGVTVPLFVIRNLPTSVRDVIDTNVRRTASDTLGFAGLHNTGRYAATARMIMARQDGYYTAVNDRRRPPGYSNSEILSFIETHPAIESAVTRANASYRAIGMRSTALWAYCLYEFDYVDQDASETFERSLVELTGFGENDPRATLVRWMTDTRRSGLHSTILTPRSLFAVFRCWNAWRNGETLQKVQMGDGAAIPTPV